MNSRDDTPLDLDDSEYIEHLIETSPDRKLAEVAAAFLAKVDTTAPDIDALDAPLHPDARMEAYYYSFDRTGVAAVDAILSAVAVAGKGSHSTDMWSDEDTAWYYKDDRPGLPSGMNAQSAIDLIQKTAAASASEHRALVAEVRTLRAEAGTGAALIAAERRRQVEEEGYDAEHDRHQSESLTAAAINYATGARFGWQPTDAPPSIGVSWPWHLRFWKPTGDPRRDLVKAGALIAAAIDALPKDAD